MRYLRTAGAAFCLMSVLDVAAAAPVKGGSELPLTPVRQTLPGFEVPVELPGVAVLTMRDEKTELTDNKTKPTGNKTKPTGNKAKPTADKTELTGDKTRLSGIVKQLEGGKLVLEAGGEMKQLLVKDIQTIRFKPELSAAVGRASDAPVRDAGNEMYLSSSQAGLRISNGQAFLLLPGTGTGAGLPKYVLRELRFVLRSQRPEITLAVPKGRPGVAP